MLLIIIWTGRILAIVLIYALFLFTVTTIARDLDGSQKRGDRDRRSVPLVLRVEAGEGIRFKRVPAGVNMAGGPSEGLVLPSDRNFILYIGRGEENDIVVDDPYVSEHHAVIYRENGVLWLRDLGSSNHTFVNGRSVDNVALKAGDTIGFGNALCRLGE